MMATVAPVIMDTRFIVGTVHFRALILENSEDVCSSRREAESILCGSNLRSIGHMTPRVAMNEVQYKTLILLETL